jgi:hypothetical protein
LELEHLQIETRLIDEKYANFDGKKDMKRQEKKYIPTTSARNFNFFMTGHEYAVPATSAGTKFTTPTEKSL